MGGERMRADHALMAEVGFYHLTRSSLEQALPRLLKRTLAASQRALVMTSNDAERDVLNEALWQQPEWLPHGIEADGDADLQPIWLASQLQGREQAETPEQEQAPNGARFLFLTYGASSDRLDRFERVFDLFDGTNEAAVQAARGRWSAARSGGHTVAYWQQTDKGWQQKA
jgi:DNA polymerase III subunit chi